MGGVAKKPKKIIMLGCNNIRIVMLATKALGLHVTEYGQQPSESAEYTLPFNPGHLILFKVTTTKTAYTIEVLDHLGHVQLD